MMKLSERSIKIKELISGQVDMGTFGLVELELIEFDKELAELKKMRVADVSICACGSDKLYSEQYKDVIKYYCSKCHKNIESKH